MQDVIEWLLEGDASIRYMACRDLLCADAARLSELRGRIASEGFGQRFLSCRGASGHWGIYYYQPKWTCTHYTLLDLKNLCAPEDLGPCREMVLRMLEECRLPDGGLNLSRYAHPGDTCVDGMALSYASYFCGGDPRLGHLAAHLLSVQKADGGFSWDAGSPCGDPHTTICVLEGLAQYLNSLPAGSTGELESARGRAEGFLLENRLFMDGGDKRFLKLSYPFRYRYDLLRALEYFTGQDRPLDARLQPALDWLRGRRQPDGRWRLENTHKGNVHFMMEAQGAPGRFVTLKALGVLKRAGKSQTT